VLLVSSKALVAFGVVDGQRRTVVAVRLINLGATVSGKAGSFADKNSSLGMDAVNGGGPEGTTQVDPSELVGI